MTASRRSGLAFPMANPYSLAMDFWLLGLDSAVVIGLRTLKIAAGGIAAEQESQQMITEKVMAAVELPLKLANSGANSPAAVATSTLRHYSKKVRANRRRLSRAEPNS